VAVLGGAPYSYFRYETHLAALRALPVYEHLCDEFQRQFGRQYAAVEGYRSDDADFVLVMMGCFATKAKEAVDRLREAGAKVGLVRPRLLRPFPEQALQGALSGKRAIAVIDQNLSIGKGGVLYSEITSALYGRVSPAPMLLSYIGGLGGRDITQEEFFQIVKELRQAAQTGQAPPPRLLYTEEELRQVDKLQAVAHAERHELRTNK
jgi:pyruvate ferredoxin oxidoreductase alpha subunit